MNATDLTQAFARAAGYTGSSQAMLGAMEAIRLHGVTEARAGHFERKAIVERTAKKLKADGYEFKKVLDALFT